MSCPDENTLLDLMQGNLQAEERERVLSHLDTCADCRAVVGDPDTEPHARTMKSLASSAKVTLPAESLARTHVGRAGRAAPRPSSSRLDPLIGQTVGEYEVKERIGSGGMGVVYRGRHPLIGKEVAIKLLRPDIAASADNMRRMLLEARAVNAIGHRSIVDIFGFGELPDGRQYMVMEYLSGEPLDRWLEHQSRLAWELILRFIEEIAAALHAAHSAGVIHRDLKPSNLFVVSADEHAPLIKLLDFGLAKQLSEHATSGGTVGTPHYMAPEQIHLRNPISPRTDLYALGLVAYELCTGRLPFTSSGSIREVMEAQLHEEPTPPRALREDLPASLESLILQLLAKEPSARPESGEAVRVRVRELRQQLGLAGMTGPRPIPESAKPPLDSVTAGTPTDPDPRRAPRRWMLYAAGAAVLLISAGVAVAFGIEKPEPQHEEVKPVVVAAVEPVAEKKEPVVEEKLPVVEEPPPEEVKPDEPKLSKKKKPAPRVPTSTQLLARSGSLRRELKARTPAGEDPDAMAMLLLKDAEKRATQAKSDGERLKIASMLDDIERKYVKH